MKEVLVGSDSSDQSPVASLKKGSRVAVVSPASYAKPELVERGVARLRAFGYEPVVMPHALARGPLYYAGTAGERVADEGGSGGDLVAEREGEGKVGVHMDGPPGLVLHAAPGGTDRCGPCHDQ